jgi:uncharacterized protein
MEDPADRQSLQYLTEGLRKLDNIWRTKETIA